MHIHLLRVARCDTNKNPNPKPAATRFRGDQKVTV
jgi:hypothetical protein